MTARTNVPIAIDIDLRHVRDSVPEWGSFSEWQREMLHDRGTGAWAVNRIVVCDAMSSVARHADILNDIASSPAVDSVLLIVVGSSQIDDSGKHLRLPPVTRQRNVATLWVGDERGGVEWALGSWRPESLVSDEGVVPALLSTVKVPEVFDFIVDAVSRMNPSVACPGVDTVVTGATGGEAAMLAEASAITALVGNGRDAAVMSSSPELDNFLVRLCGGTAAGEASINANGEFGRFATEAIAALAAAKEAVGRASGGASHEIDGRLAAAAVSHAGRAVDRVRSHLIEVFSQVDGTDGLDHAEAQAVHALGLEAYGQADATDADDRAADALRARAVAVLEASQSLSATAADLRIVANRASPRSRDETIALVDAACPPALCDSLVNTTSYQVRLTSPTTLSLTALAFALAAITRSFWVPGVIAITFTFAVAMSLLLTKGLRPSLSAIRNELKAIQTRVQIAVLLGAAIAGNAVGTVAAEVTPNSTLMGIIGLIVGAAVFLWAILRAWRCSAGAWGAGLGLDEMVGRVRALTELASDVAFNDWFLSGQRIRLRHVAEGIAASCQVIRTSLMTDLVPQAGSLHDSLVEDSPVQRSLANSGTGLARYSSQINQIVLNDYIDTVSRVLASCLTEIVGRSADAASQKVDERFRKVLRDYRWHLSHAGVLALPPSRSIASEERRRELVASLWGDANQLNPILRRIVDDSMVQLVSPDDIALLSHDRQATVMVRFAPRAARSHALPNAGDVIWTESDDVAGVIRLVPVQAGIVDLVVDLTEERLKSVGEPEPDGSGEQHAPKLGGVDR